MTRLPVAALVGAAAIVNAGGVRADTIELPAAADTSLYEESTLFSNGAGDHFFCGLNNGGFKRRGLIRFDVAGNIPAGSVITDATLTLYMSRTTAPPTNVSIHRVTQGWGEAGSDAPDAEGGGAPAMPGDATWLYRFVDAVNPLLSPPWSSPGGDYAFPASATTLVADFDWYDWSSPAMLDDVRGWFEDPGGSRGWIVIGNEDFVHSAKRFDSRTAPLPQFRPVLSVTFDPPPCPADLDGSGDVGFGDILQIIGAWGPCGVPCPEDLSGNGAVDFADILAVIAAWGPC
ncbi:MAG: DNRLRE domain-containing protein [Planctomycetota bacterium]|jgi:hypothetical protein